MRLSWPSPWPSPAGRGEFVGMGEGNTYCLRLYHVGAGFKPAQADGKCYFQGRLASEKNTSGGKSLKPL